MPTFTLKDLEKHNGKDGERTYVAVDGEIYDISDSSMWEKGNHMGQHHAGCDLTDAISMAPHGKEVLEGFKKAGALASAPKAEDAIVRKAPPAWATMLLSFHSHPIASHFPQAFFVFAPLFILLFYVTGVRSFERTAYHLIGAGFLMALPATATGFLHWRYKFGGRSRPVFKLKIILSLVLLPMGGLVFIMHTYYGPLISGSFHWIILLLYCAMIPLVVSLGRLGGQIVFDGKGR
jgi:predicted heme/steroid binding protein/uncharacterized membrane protein